MARRIAFGLVAAAVLGFVAYAVVATGLLSAASAGVAAGHAGGGH